ncbi:hypothetical protein M426DRAFT_109051 [Hypoxylon sp. CI-4A]|nr:hypothetical protein M426DRAFT_109051 [Hypoxylon sp. CI-4A]
MMYLLGTISFRCYLRRRPKVEVRWFRATCKKAAVERDWKLEILEIGTPESLKRPCADLGNLWGHCNSRARPILSSDRYHHI